MQPHRQPELAQLQFRGFFEELDHPVIGASRYSTLPDEVLARSGTAARTDTRRCSASTTTELLGELGLTRSELDALEAARRHRQLAGP